MCNTYNPIAFTHELKMLSLIVPIPIGYEATGEFRWPTPGEPFLTPSGTACVAGDNDQCARRMHRIILRKLWSFPSWFRKGWWLYRRLSIDKWFVCDQPLGFYPEGTLRPLLAADSLWKFHGEEFSPPSGIDQLQCS